MVVLTVSSSVAGKVRYVAAKMAARRVAKMVGQRVEMMAVKTVEMMAVKKVG